MHSHEKYQSDKANFPLMNRVREPEPVHLHDVHRKQKCCSHYQWFGQHFSLKIFVLFSANVHLHSGVQYVFFFQNKAVVLIMMADGPARVDGL